MHNVLLFRLAREQKSKIEKSRIAAALSEKVCVYSIKEGKFAN